MTHTVNIRGINCQFQNYNTAFAQFVVSAAKDISFEADSMLIVTWDRALQYNFVPSTVSIQKGIQNNAH